METGIFEIEFHTGQVYRVIFSNSSQKHRVLNICRDIVGELKEVNIIVNGLHNVAQFETIINQKTN